MQLYRLTNLSTGSTIIVCAKSPVAARKVAAKDHGLEWASSTATRCQGLKATGKSERIILGPVVASVSEDESYVSEDESQEPEITTEQAIYKLAGIVGDWLVRNKDSVQGFVGKIVG